MIQIGPLLGRFGPFWAVLGRIGGCTTPTNAQKHTRDHALSPMGAQGYAALALGVSLGYTCANEVIGCDYAGVSTLLCRAIRVGV